MAKIIVLGPQCSGKTTIACDLRLFSTIPVIDEDEEINRRNGGKSPSNWTEWARKWTVLRPEVHKDILTMSNVIFFASFFDIEHLLQAKRKGFTVIQLTASDEVLRERNRKRVEDGVDDATYGWNINMPYHAEIRSRGLVDMVLGTDRPVRELSELILITNNIAQLSRHILRAFTRQNA